MNPVALAVRSNERLMKIIVIFKRLSAAAVHTCRMEACPVLWGQDIRRTVASQLNVSNRRCRTVCLDIITFYLQLYGK